MPLNSVNSPVLDSFAKQNKELWRQIASQETEGADPLKTLSWKSESDSTFFPYYDADDVAHLNYLNKARLTVAQNSFLGNRKWISAPIVTINDDVNANKISLQHLAQGADGIFFNNSSKITDASQLLTNIEWQYCSLFFKNPSGEALLSLQNFILQKKLDHLSGALFWDVIPKKSDVNFFIEKLSAFKSLGLTIHDGYATEQISHALIMGVNTVEYFKNHFDIENIFKAIAFSVPINQLFVETIAKLKVLRLLWFQVAQTYGCQSFYPDDLHIHAYSPTWSNEKFQPHANMLKGTTAAMASIIGGCDSLTIIPENENHSTMNRIARNISSVLREECHFDKVADPLAGAFAIDVVTDTLAKESWKLFQTKLNA
jgi:methylmalonyl-CoA mutase